MTGDELLCPDCHHPRRKHSSYGCTAAGGTCECATSPAEMDAPAAVEPATVDMDVELLQASPDASGDVELDALLAKARGTGSRTLVKAADRLASSVRVLREMVETWELRAETEAKVAKLREELAQAEALLRQTGGKRVPAPGEPTSAQVRAWAAGNGVKCPPLGRVPYHVMDQYNAAHGGAA